MVWVIAVPLGATYCQLVRVVNKSNSESTDAKSQLISYSCVRILNVCDKPAASFIENAVEFSIIFWPKKRTARGVIVSPSENCALVNEVKLT